MAKRNISDPQIEPKVFRSTNEIDSAIKKLERRINDVGGLDVAAAYRERNGQDDVVRSNVSETIREVFGQNSPEFREHEHIRIWSGPMSMNMAPARIIEGKEKGKVYVVSILNGLINRLKEKREELEDPNGRLTASAAFRTLDIHPRVRLVADQLFADGHYWEAVFNASKALVNYIKEKAARFDLDGAALVTTVFSKNNPILAFNDLADQTEQDEQQGMMHLYVGAVLAIRNPGGHGFPEGSGERALEYIQLLSLLAYRVDEAKRT